MIHHRSCDDAIVDRDQLKPHAIEICFGAVSQHSRLAGRMGARAVQGGPLDEIPPAAALAWAVPDMPGPG